MDCKASEKDDPTVDPRFGKVGKQIVKDTGPLNKKRMETVDDEIAAKAEDFIKRQVKAKKPFFTWINFTHMHFRTHTKPESLGQAGVAQSYYHDTMIDHDKNVGQILDLIDEARHRRRHDRRLLHRQRPAPQLVARCRHHEVPQREEHRLGGRLPRSAVRAVARQDQARLDLERDHVASRLGADPACRRRQHGRQGETAHGL